jgi:TPR repeat protein
MQKAKEYPGITSRPRNSSAKQRRKVCKAQYYLANLYTKGHGVQQDFTGAARWYMELNEVAQAKDQMGQTNLL